jgi:hypothetical protein
MPHSNQVKLVVPNGQKIYRKPNTAATVGPQNNPRPGSNLPKNSPRKPPTLGTPIK